jgi:hypothetical protein
LGSKPAGGAAVGAGVIAGVGAGVGRGVGRGVTVGPADVAGVGDSDAVGSAEGDAASQVQSVVCGLADASWLGAAETMSKVGSSLAVWFVEQADAISTSEARIASARLGPRVDIMPTLRATPGRGSKRC